MQSFFYHATTIVHLWISVSCHRTLHSLTWHDGRPMSLWTFWYSLQPCMPRQDPSPLLLSGVILKVHVQQELHCGSVDVSTLSTDWENYKKQCCHPSDAPSHPYWQRDCFYAWHLKPPFDFCVTFDPHSYLNIIWPLCGYICRNLKVRMSRPTPSQLNWIPLGPSFWIHWLPIRSDFSQSFPLKHGPCHQ